MFEIIKENIDKIILSVGGILIALVSFGVGRITAIKKSEPVIIRDAEEHNDNLLNKNNIENNTNNNANDFNNLYGKYVGSLGDNIYYVASDIEAADIEDNNKIWFETEEEAKEQGYIAASNIENSDNASNNSIEDLNGEAADGKYLASKNGSKYYLPECSGAKRIKEDNKIWFDTVAEAEAGGYEPAKNCQGLE